MRQGSGFLSAAVMEVVIKNSVIGYANRSLLTINNATQFVCRMSASSGSNGSYSKTRDYKTSRSKSGNLVSGYVAPSHSYLTYCSVSNHH